VLEDLYQLVQHCGLTYSEAWDMPVTLREWWLKRKAKEIADRKKGKGGGGSTGHTDPFGRKYP
jgi:hypothetical protein